MDFLRAGQYDDATAQHPSTTLQITKQHVPPAEDESGVALCWSGRSYISESSLGSQVMQATNSVQVSNDMPSPTSSISRRLCCNPTIEPAASDEPASDRDQQFPGLAIKSKAPFEAQSIPDTEAELQNIQQTSEDGYSRCEETRLELRSEPLVHGRYTPSESSDTAVVSDSDLFSWVEGARTAELAAKSKAKPQGNIPILESESARKLIACKKAPRDQANSLVPSIAQPKSIDDGLILPEFAAQPMSLRPRSQAAASSTTPPPPNHAQSPRRPTTKRRRVGHSDGSANMSRPVEADAAIKSNCHGRNKKAPKPTVLPDAMCGHLNTADSPLTTSTGAARRSQRLARSSSPSHKSFGSDVATVTIGQKRKRGERSGTSLDMDGEPMAAQEQALSFYHEYKDGLGSSDHYRPCILDLCNRFSTNHEGGLHASKMHQISIPTSSDSRLATYNQLLADCVDAVRKVDSFALEVAGAELLKRWGMVKLARKCSELEQELSKSRNEGGLPLKRGQGIMSFVKQLLLESLNSDHYTMGRLTNTLQQGRRWKSVVDAFGPAFLFMVLHIPCSQLTRLRDEVYRIWEQQVKERHSFLIAVCQRADTIAEQLLDGRPLDIINDANGGAQPVIDGYGELMHVLTTGMLEGGNKAGIPLSERRKLVSLTQKRVVRLDLRSEVVLEDQKPQLRQLREAFHNCKRIVVVAGAGISTAAGSRYLDSMFAVYSR